MSRFDIPSQSSENSENKERKRIFNEKVEEVKKRLDKVGGEMDPAIIETVTALNLHGIPTSQSCEGHVDHGRPVPWIMVKAPNKPTERYNDENAIKKSIAAKHGLTSAQLRDDEYREAWQEACKACEESGESDAFQAWRKVNEKNRDKLDALLQTYAEQRGEIEAQLQLSIQEMGDGKIFTIYIGGEDVDLDVHDLSAQERIEVADRLSSYQQEMKLFTEFLKKHYLENPTTE